MDSLTGIFKGVIKPIAIETGLGGLMIKFQSGGVAWSGKYILFFRLLHVKLTLDLLVSFRRESRARKYELWKQGALKAVELLWHGF